MEKKAKLDSETKAIHTFVDEVEAIRTARQREYREQPHPGLKRFTQQELNDESCTTYKNWLTGRSLRLPARTTVLAIADYLECSSTERSDLLLAAGYAPEQHELEGRPLRLAMEQAYQIMNSLPWPAFIAMHSFDIAAVNTAFQRLYEIPFEQVPPANRNMIHFHFHPQFPVRSRSTFSKEALRLWEAHAIYGAELFKDHHQYARHDAWYRSLLQRYQDIADFKTYWKQAGQSPEHAISETKLLLARINGDADLVPVRLRQVHLSVSARMFPRVEAFLPEDDAARRLFAQLGCPSDGFPEAGKA